MSEREREKRRELQKSRRDKTNEAAMVVADFLSRNLQMCENCLMKRKEDLTRELTCWLRVRVWSRLTPKSRTDREGEMDEEPMRRVQFGGSLLS